MIILRESRRGHPRSHPPTRAKRKKRHNPLVTCIRVSNQKSKMLGRKNQKKNRKTRLKLVKKLFKSHANICRTTLYVVSYQISEQIKCLLFSCLMWNRITSKTAFVLIRSAYYLSSSRQFKKEWLECKLHAWGNMTSLTEITEKIYLCVL